MTYFLIALGLAAVGVISYFLGKAKNSEASAKDDLNQIEQDKKLHDKVKEDTANLSDADLADSLRDWIHK